MPMTASSSTGSTVQPSPTTSSAGAINTTIAGNSVHDNGFGGIAVLDGSGPTSVYVTNNRVFNNSTATNGYGIAASGPVTLVSGNTVTGQSGSGAYGIQASFGATVDGNTVSGNTIGIGAQDTGTIVSNNRVFANTTNGRARLLWRADDLRQSNLFQQQRHLFIRQRRRRHHFGQSDLCQCQRCNRPVLPQRGQHHGQYDLPVGRNGYQPWELPDLSPCHDHD